MEEKILYKELCYKLYGIFYAVHNEHGPLRSEKTYADYVEKSLESDGFMFDREKSIQKKFDDNISERDRPDFIIDNKIIVDIKAKRIITKQDYFQMKRYLAASGYKLGLIVNFRQKYLYPKRILA